MDAVGIGGMGHALFRGLGLAREFRRRGRRVFFGGTMASLVPELVLREVDAVVVGDGERALPRLLADLEAGKLEHVYRDPLTGSTEGSFARRGSRRRAHVPELLLVQPSQYSADRRTLVRQRRLQLPGLALPLLAATVPPGWRVRIALEVVEPVDLGSAS